MSVLRHRKERGFFFTHSCRKSLLSLRRRLRIESLYSLASSVHLRRSFSSLSLSRRSFSSFSASLFFWNSFSFSASSLSRRAVSLSPKKIPSFSNYFLMLLRRYEIFSFGVFPFWSFREFHQRYLFIYLFIHLLTERAASISKNSILSSFLR